jgi:hypothetical protein
MTALLAHMIAGIHAPNPSTGLFQITDSRFDGVAHDADAAAHLPPPAVTRSVLGLWIFSLMPL